MSVADDKDFAIRAPYIQKIMDLEATIKQLQEENDKLKAKHPDYDLPSIESDGDAFDKHFEKRIDGYADKHPALLVRQLARRLRSSWAEISALRNQASEPFAWATFDGEGSYDLRLYQDNEYYDKYFYERNGEKYKGWVKKLYAAPAKPDHVMAECTENMWDEVWKTIPVEAKIKLSVSTMREMFMEFHKAMINASKGE